MRRKQPPVHKNSLAIAPEVADLYAQAVEVAMEGAELSGEVAIDYDLALDIVKELARDYLPKEKELQRAMLAQFKARVLEYYREAQLNQAIQEEAANSQKH